MLTKKRVQKKALKKRAADANKEINNNTKDKRLDFALVMNLLILGAEVIDEDQINVGALLDLETETLPEEHASIINNFKMCVLEDERNGNSGETTFH